MKWAALSTLTFLTALVCAQAIKVGRDPSDLKFSANGRFLAVSCDDHIYVRDLLTARTYRCPSGEFCDISPGGTRLAIRDPQRERLTIWDVARSRPIRVWNH